MAEGKQKPRTRPTYEPEVVKVPAGPFLMGSCPGEGIPEHETPLHEVSLPMFFIGRLPITNEQYEPFVRKAKHEAPKSWILRKPPKGCHDHPVTGINWDDAMAYCAWLKEQTGRPYRLPSEAEWEKAARSIDGQLYPWGNAWKDNCCNNNSSNISPVTAFPTGASPYNCLDMLGNVQEWTMTIWGRNPDHADFSYPFQMDGRNDPNPVSRRVFRIHRGGCFRDQAKNLRCALRSFSVESTKVNWLGFRVVMEEE